MRADQFLPTAPGQLAPTVSGAVAFVPDPAPRTLPLDGTLARLNGLAERRLGELTGAAGRVVNPLLVSAPLLRQEALLSSRIEGTMATPEQLALIEVGSPAATPDAGEVNNFVRATQHALERLAEGDLIASPLMRDAHRILMQGVRGDRERPGEFRDAQNFIGSSLDIHSARFVPPPPLQLGALMADLERYLHDELPAMPDLVRAAIAHYQFETIHPFLDGNGRIGRLMIPLYLISNKILKQPVLYLSDYLERNREEYYERLTRVRDHHDLSGWLHFFLDGITETAKNGVATFDQILQLQKHWEKEIGSWKPRTAHGLKLFTHLFTHPWVNAAQVSEVCSVSPGTAYTLIERFVTCGLLREITGAKRGKLYLFDPYLKLFR